MNKEQMIFNYIKPSATKYKVRGFLLLGGIVVMALKFIFTALPTWVLILGLVVALAGLYLYLDDKGYGKRAKKSIAYLKENDLLERACEEFASAENNFDCPVVYTDKFIFVRGAGTALCYDDIESLTGYKQGSDPVFYSRVNAFDAISVKAHGEKFFLTGEGTPYDEFPQIMEILKEKRADLFTQDK